MTEFIFVAASTITIPVTQQSNLDALFEPAVFPQTIAVKHALCRDIDGKDRPKIQRAIARYHRYFVSHRQSAVHPLTHLGPFLTLFRRLMGSII